MKESNDFYQAMSDDLYHGGKSQRSTPPGIVDAKLYSESLNEVLQRSSASTSIPSGTTAMKYYIWSHRHSEWWGPDKQGYTQNITEAGLYSREEAADITFSCLPGANVAVANNIAHRFVGQPPKRVEDELAELRRL